MPGPTPSTSESVTRTELPGWVNDAAKSNWKMARDVDPKVAGFSPTTTQAFKLFKDNLGTGSDESAAASKIFSDMARPSSYAGAAGNIWKRLADPNSLSREIGGYLNPYINEVESKSLDALNDTRERALVGNADAATKARAFGGSRAAVVDAITNAESAKDAGLLSAQLRSQGYSDAVSNRRADLTTAGQGFLNSDAARTSTMSAAGQGLLATGDQKQAQLLKDFQTLGSIGSQEQAQKQAKLNSPIDKLNLRLAALGMTPYNTSSSTSTTGTAGSPGFDWGTGIMGGLSLLAGLL